MRRVVYSAKAEADLAAIYTYLDQHSTTAADRLAVAVDARCGLLAAQPTLGRRRDDLLPGMRSSVIGQYLLFYVFDDTTLEVVRFIHGARHLPDEFAEG